MFVCVCNPMEKTSNLFDWFCIGYTHHSFVWKYALNTKTLWKSQTLIPSKKSQSVLFNRKKYFLQNKMNCLSSKTFCHAVWINWSGLTVLIDSAILYMTGLTSQQGSIVPATVREMNPQSSPGLMNWTQRFAIVVFYQSDHCLLSNAKHNLVLPKWKMDSIWVKFNYPFFFFP